MLQAKSAISHQVENGSESTWPARPPPIGKLLVSSFLATATCFAEEEYTSPRSKEACLAYRASPFSELSIDYFARFSRDPRVAPSDGRNGNRRDLADPSTHRRQTTYGTYGGPSQGFSQPENGAERVHRETGPRRLIKEHGRSRDASGKRGWTTRTRPKNPSGSPPNRGGSSSRAKDPTAFAAASSNSLASSASDRRRFCNWANRSMNHVCPCASAKSPGWVRIATSSSWVTTVSSCLETKAEAASGRSPIRPSASTLSPPATPFRNSTHCEIQKPLRRLNRYAEGARKYGLKFYIWLQHAPRIRARSPGLQGPSGYARRPDVRRQELVPKGGQIHSLHRVAPRPAVYLGNDKGPLQGSARLVRHRRHHWG